VCVCVCVRVEPGAEKVKSFLLTTFQKISSSSANAGGGIRMNKKCPGTVTTNSTDRRHVHGRRRRILLRLLVPRLHGRLIGRLGSRRRNQLLLLLDGSRNLLQQRLVVVNAGAWANHGLTLDSNRLATVVTSARPSLPVHDSPIRICRSRKSNK
jgi:hypothetical protein